MKNISRHIIIFIVGILSLITTSSAQKVGLVLSGGGAKGLYHVGVIKALEENGIPIDYISGASMGAIVGGLYAMGYSPDDMIKFFESDSVMDWINGEIPTEYKYYFKKDGTTPDMVTISINNNKTTTKGSKSGFQLPTSILSPYLLDMAFTEMMQGASWAANENFDSLMVPFRCVASDSYNKKLITFRDGSLAFAVRSSMSIPFIFKPLKYDSVLLYDGGIINNFPWQCLKDDFNPDILIGCVCSGNGDNPKEDDLMGQITTLITSPTDYSFSEADSIKGSTIIKRRFYEVSTLEYNKAHYIIEKGYNDAIEKMPELLQHISRRVDSTEISSKRTAFRRKIKPLIFDDVIIDGVTPAQKSYILHQLGYLTPGKDYDMSYFKQKYFRLIGAGIFEGKFPTITYNPETERYQLHLTFSTKPSMQFSFGGNISSTSLNQVYMGFMYSHVNRIASSYFIGGLLGTYYNSVTIGGRHDIYTNFPFFIQYHYAWEQYDFTCNNMSRYHKDQIFRLNQAVNNSLNLTLGASAFTNYVFKLSWAGILSEYKYYPGTHISTETEDRTKFLYSKLTTSLEKNSLNYTLYPSLGTQFDIGLSYYAGIETYSKGTSIFSQLFEGEEFEGQNRSWVELRSKVESYHFINNWFNLGFLGDLKISNAPSFGTDIADYFIRTQFSPTPHASSMFMKEFRSASHIALGLVPIFKFTNNQKFYLKAYAYCYVPQEVIYEDNSWQPFSTKRFKEYVQGIFGGSLVYQTPLGPASLSYNNYTTGPNNWSLMVNFGFALFKTSN